MEFIKIRKAQLSVIGDLAIIAEKGEWELYDEKRLRVRMKTLKTNSSNYKQCEKALDALRLK